MCLIPAGMILLARELIQNGTFVVLAANETSALRDITVADLKSTSQSKQSILCTTSQCMYYIAAGMIPLARELIKNGTFVVLAANETPALNDITAAELRVLLQDCAKVDKLLGRAVQEQVISVVSSGSSLPIIDLTKVHRWYFAWPISKNVVCQ